MAKRLLLFLGVIVASVSTQAFAQSGGFPCDAFKVQPNGRVEVVRPVTVTGPNGKMTLNPGISFGPDILVRKRCLPLPIVYLGGPPSR